MEMPCGRRPRRYGLVLVCALFVCALWAAAAAGRAATRQDDLTGQVQSYLVQPGDDVPAVARRFDIGVVELLAANSGLKSPQLQAGMRLVIPTRHIVPRTGEAAIVVNLSGEHLYRIRPDGKARIFPVAIGEDGLRTPTGRAVVKDKRPDPVWRPSAQLRSKIPALPDEVPPGPSNPLGAYALDLDLPGVAISGTNTPARIGMPATTGNIAMYDEDVRVIAEDVQPGLPVIIVDMPFLLGRHDGALYIEVSPTPEQADAIAEYQPPAPLSDDDPRFVELAILLYVANAHGDPIDFRAVAAAVGRHDGIPVNISLYPNGRAVINSLRLDQDHEAPADSAHKRASTAPTEGLNAFMRKSHD